MSEDNRTLVRRFYDEIFTKKNANAIDMGLKPLVAETVLEYPACRKSLTAAHLFAYEDNATD